MKWYQWIAIAVLGALLLVAGGAAAGYLIRSSSAQAFDAYRKGGEDLTHAGAVKQQALVDSIMRQVRLLLVAANSHATDGAQHDTAAVGVGTEVTALKAELANARTVVDSVHRYPPIVAGLDRQVAQLDSSSTAWRLGFRDQSTALAGMTARIVSDSSWALRLIAHIDSVPKAPRTSLGNFLIHPKAYVRTELGVKTGWDARVGACWGGCGP